MLAVSSFCSLLYPLLTILSRAVFENKHVKRNFLVPENKLWYTFEEDTAFGSPSGGSGAQRDECKFTDPHDYSGAFGGEIRRNLEKGLDIWAYIIYYICTPISEVVMGVAKDGEAAKRGGVPHRETQSPCIQNGSTENTGLCKPPGFDKNRCDYERNRSFGG